jgi:hypothetical protein
MDGAIHATDDGASSAAEFGDRGDESGYVME